MHMSLSAAPDLAWLVTTLTMIGKAAITICFSTIYVYTAELFPTPVRHLAVGSSSMMSRIGGLVAPFMGEPLVSAHNKSITTLATVMLMQRCKIQN